MGKRKAFVHIGLPHAGGAFLDSALAEHADALEVRGVRHPAISTEEMLRTAIELRRDHQSWGYQRREVEGTWAGVCRRARKGKHDVVLSQELLAGCTREQVELLVDGLAGFEVHLVLTARDLGTQLVAAWAGSIEAGRSVSFGRFRQRITDPAREHEQARRFWDEQELGEVLARWAPAVRKPQRVHVIVVPSDVDDQHDFVWTALCAVLGIDAAALPLAAEPPQGPDATGIAVLRNVNRAVDGRLPVRTHQAMVRRYLSEGVAADDLVPPAVPADLHELLVETGDRWRKQLADGGYDVLGDTSALLPGPADPRAVPPDAVPAEERLSMATDALANVLVEVARLREHNQALEERAAKLDRKRRKLKRQLADAG